MCVDSMFVPCINTSSSLCASILHLDHFEWKISPSWFLSDGSESCAYISTVWQNIVDLLAEWDTKPDFLQNYNDFFKIQSSIMIKRSVSFGCFIDRWKWHMFLQKIGHLRACWCIPRAENWCQISHGHPSSFCSCRSSSSTTSHTSKHHNIIGAHTQLRRKNFTR